jgi:hypothetical protein
MSQSSRQQFRMDNWLRRVCLGVGLDGLGEMVGARRVYEEATGLPAALRQNRLIPPWQQCGGRLMV